jgi:hypothetical protein
VQALCKRKGPYLVGFVLHFGLIAIICLRSTLWLLGNTSTIFPESIKSTWQRAAAISDIPSDSFSGWPAVRRAVVAYTRCSGIEGGYAFFAPNIPDACKLVFELRYPDGTVEYDLPRASNAGGGLGVSALLNNIATIQYEPLRERLIETLAYSAWRGHPEAKTVRAVLGYIHLPTAAQFQKGETESYQYLYAYEFRFEDKAPRPPKAVPP